MDTTQSNLPTSDTDTADFKLQQPTALQVASFLHIGMPKDDVLLLTVKPEAKEQLHPHSDLATILKEDLPNVPAGTPAQCAVVLDLSQIGHLDGSCDQILTKLAKAFGQAKRKFVIVSNQDQTQRPLQHFGRISPEISIYHSGQGHDDPLAAALKEEFSIEVAAIGEAGQTLAEFQKLSDSREAGKAVGALPANQDEFIEVKADKAPKKYLGWMEASHAPPKPKSATPAVLSDLLEVIPICPNVLLQVVRKSIADEASPMLMQALNQQLAEGTPVIMLDLSHVDGIQEQVVYDLLRFHEKVATNPNCEFRIAAPGDSILQSACLKRFYDLPCFPDRVSAEYGVDQIDLRTWEEQHKRSK